MENLENFYSNSKDRLIKLLNQAQSGHPGGALSSLHYLSYLAFNNFIDLDKDLPLNNSPFILSPGHYCPGLYSVMVEKKVIPEYYLDKYRTAKCRLHGHPIRSIEDKIFYTSGSLGQGLSLGIGLAIGRPEAKVHVLISDGELNEGQIWESLMYIAANKINNIYLALDLNGVQLDGFTKDILNLGKIENKFKSFGFDVFSCNGNSFNDLERGYQNMIHNKNNGILILNTIIGYGIKEIEGLPDAHGCKIPDNYLKNNLM